LYLISLGREFLLQGDCERATALNEEAVALCRERRGGLVAGLGEHAQTALNNLGWVALVQGNHERANALHVESLALSEELGDKLIAAESIEGLACAAGTRGEAERAAKLFGAARTLQEAVGYHHTPKESALREPYRVAVRSRLDEVVWQAAFAEGQVMTLEEATKYGLASEESATPLSSTSEPPRGNQQSPALTGREEEIAALVARGLTNRRIASELSISEHTAATHVANILKKLRLNSRSRLATWVTEQGLPSPE
jgi:DNA-binding CsgD family transcriptional regulator